MSIASPFPDVVIPDISVYDLLFDGLDGAQLQQIATIDAADGSETTYHTLIDRIDAVAGSLAAQGIGVADVVAILSPNSADYVVAFHAVLRAGATATTVNALATTRDITKQLTDSHAKLLFTVTTLLAAAKHSATEAGLDDTSIVVIDGPGIAASTYPNLADLVDAGLPAPTVTFDPNQHLAILPYSSGTTGDPKGVMLTHRNLVANIMQTRALLNITNNARIIALLPFFHIYGITMLLNATLDARASLVIMPRFELDLFLQSVQAHRVSYGFIAPPVAVMLAKDPRVDNYDLTSLQTLVSGAAPLDAELGKSVAQRLDIDMIQGYGMSELSPVSHFTPADGGRELFGETAPYDSVGWPIPNTDNRVIHLESGMDIGIPAHGLSEQGELWVRGPNVMAGYVGNADATQATIDTDGYLHTGDVVRMDSLGRVFVVDRIKELIKYKGYQVPPAELEALLLTHPDIADAAVIGAPDDSGEEVPKAFVVRQHGSSLSEQKVIDFVADIVAPYKKVRRVEFIECVPKSSAGKILRKELRDRTDTPATTLT